MFFDNLNDLPKIIKRTNCAIFALPELKDVQLKNALYLRPKDDKVTATIGVDELRDFLALTHNRETSDRLFVISPADALNEAAQNAFLKTLEEPQTHCHFALFTTNLGQLLPTIRSRAHLFYLKTLDSLTIPPAAPSKIVASAKALIAASPSDLPQLAAEISKQKTAPRQFALDTTATAIELLYKSYFKTKNPRFLQKIPNFLKLHEALTHNGHIKLHIVADLC